MTRAMVAVLFVLTGCRLSAGHSFIGAWRAHDVPELEACLVDEIGTCKEHKSLATHVPERAYSGMVMDFFSLGVGLASYDGESTTHFRTDATIEYLRGRGAFAVGLRSGVVVETHGIIAVPVTGLVHYGLGDHVALVGGLGYIGGQLDDELSFLGGQAIAGVQYALTRSRTWNYGALSVEADSTWLAFSHLYRSTGITGNFGIYF